MLLLTASIVKNSHILAGIYFIFLKNVQDQTYVFQLRFVFAMSALQKQSSEAVL